MRMLKMVLEGAQTNLNIYYECFRLYQTKVKGKDMKRHLKRGFVGLVVFLVVTSVLGLILFDSPLAHATSAHAQELSGHPAQNCDATPGISPFGNNIVVWPCNAVGLDGDCLNERQGPGPHFMGTPFINCDLLNQKNNVFLITCQTMGDDVYGSTIWDQILLSPKRIGDPIQYAYASDYYMATKGFNQFSQDQGLYIPKCS
jgi:hypothetical protein